MLLKISSERNSEESIRYAPVLQHIKSKYCGIIYDLLNNLQIYFGYYIQFILIYNVSNLSYVILQNPLTV